jgi:xylan 1,4-beta-xylosidase
MGKLPTILAMLLIIPIGLYAVFQNHDLRRSAFGKKADIKIDVSKPGGLISKSLWQNFSQGGEEPKDMIAPVKNEVANLQPEIIRIDHIFDYYVGINGRVYDFSKLDQIVQTILDTGAKPMFSLSYMPPEIAVDGQKTSPPQNWNQWNELVKATISRYSGQNNFNLNNIYYEVWNEPDLFGGWHYGREPNYLTLYYHTVKSAQEIENVNNFKIGGPATTGFYPNWIKALFDYCYKNKLRIDFVSWHHYSKNINEYLRDFEKLNQILTDYGDYFNVERLITEYGPDSENSPWYDNHLGAVHSLAGVTKLMGKVHRIFAFQLKDGPSPESKKYWGRWGLISHENHEISLKPRYYAYQFLNQLEGQQLPLEGEGSWVSAAAVKKDNKIQVLVVNYDPSNNHYESPPITLENIEPGNYIFRQIRFQGQAVASREKIEKTTITKKFILQPNSAILLEWIKL